MLTDIEQAYLENYKRNFIDKCPICGGTNPACSCWAGYKLEIAKISANIPAKYRLFKLKQLTHPQLQKQKEIIKNYIKNLQNNRLEGKSLYIYGTKGTAKTMCASIVLMNALKQGYKAYYFASLKEMASMLKQDWDNDTDKLSSIITGYDFIAVDNLGIDNIVNGNIIDNIKGMFNTRSNYLLPTLFVSPVSISKVTAPLDTTILELYTPVLKDIYFNGFDYEEAVLKKVRVKNGK